MSQTITMTVGQKCKVTVTGNGLINNVARTGVNATLIDVHPDPAAPSDFTKAEITALAAGTCYVTTYANNNSVQTGPDTFVVNPEPPATVISTTYTTPA